MRALVCDILRRADIEAFEASDAEAALTVARQEDPDVVLLDHRIPPLSGFEIAERILGERPDQVIFLFTALLDADVRDKADDLGITMCLSKDQVFEIPDLVRDHLNRA